MKILISLIVLFVFSNLAYANSSNYVSPNVFAPQWSDVCPYAAFWNIDVNKEYKKADKKYWKERRIQFDKEIKACDQNAINVDECYVKVVEINAQRSANWKESYNQEALARGLKGTAAAAAVTAVGIAAMKYLF